MRKNINFASIFILFLALFLQIGNLSNKEPVQITQNGKVYSNYNELYGVEPLKRSQIVFNDTKKSLKYIAVFIEFSDSATYPNHLDDDESVSNAEIIMNSDELFTMDTVTGKVKVPSFKKYYERESYGKLSITTEFFPKQNGKVVSYVDPHPMAYYQKYSDSNPIGYKDTNESLQRETELINNATSYVSSQIEQAGIKATDIDTGNDGIVDAISFFVEGKGVLDNPVGWGDLLWSHKMDNYGISATILGKRVVSYNLLYAYDYSDAAGLFSLNRGTYGTIIHEFGHTLGYVDLYRFAPSKGNPVGFFDIMGSTIGSNPQSFLTYFISEYNQATNWHQPLPVIDKTTTNITLSKPNFTDSNEKRAVKVQLSSDGEEYFIIEYHDKKDTYEAYSVDESGIIVYRVNEKNKYSGNKEGGDHGELDHIFVFRPNETGLGDGNGTISQATLNLNRPKLGKNIDVDNHDFDAETIYYSNGNNSGIIIEVLNQTSETVTFNVTFPNIGGDGTETSPYLIGDVNTFLYLMQLDSKGKYYQLTADLDFKDVNNYPSMEFYGTLEGNGHTLSNISSKNSGVFYNIGEYNARATVQNLYIENIKSTGTGDSIGGFSSVITNGKIKNVHVLSGTITNITSINELASTGGFAGNTFSSSSIEDCSASANVSAPKNVGGFIGINSNAMIKNSYSESIVSGDKNIGGFIGIQSITEAPYKVPENVYYKSNLSAVGGHAGFLHNLTILPEQDLGKGITKIVVLEQVSVKKNETISYSVTLPTTYESKMEKPDIAEYQAGQLKGLQAGNTKLYLIFSIGSRKIEIITEITVVDSTLPDIEITEIILDKSKLELEENERVKLNVIIKPTNHTMSNSMDWKSSDANIVSVDEFGNLTAIKSGTATITATTVNGKKAECIVTVIVAKKLNENEVLNSFGLTKKENYVTGFQIGSNVANIRNKLSSNTKVTLSSFKSANGVEITSGTIATNMKFTLRFNNQEYHYTVVVKGDVNGDGLIYATDYVKIKNHIMGKTALNGAYLLAADINNDNRIYATDYVRIKNYIMGKGTIEQQF